ncbi:MAG TPA: hypothetical protein VG053_12585 [Solirubrobacteraceae bacterium]|jgi:hypothetical protein|nr:hypothetical protein [Solirubrobacteraceae bacterium]
MRSSGLSAQLEAALGEYAQAAAHLLHADILAGAEVELELGSQRGRAQTPFYSYRPLTDRFIAAREPQLARMPEHDAAVTALAGFDGLDRYLARHTREGRGGRGGDLPSGREHAGASARACAALRVLLNDIFAEQTEFELRPERLAAALARLERAELTGAPDTVTLIATLHGLTIASPEIRLTTGLQIARPETLRWAPAQALLPSDSAPEHLLVALTCEQAADGRAVLTDLLRALRLFGDGRVTLGALAWARTGGEDAWSTVALGTGGRPHGMLVVSPEQEDELRAFCSLVSRRAPHGNELAWALRRFELGCERPHPYEALSDHLLALRALLEPEGPSSGLLAGRIAALCATPENRVKLTERMTKAQKLERAVIAGTAAERTAGVTIARDVADHLRALLRDVICGHLTPDLARLADELLASGEYQSVPEVEPAVEAHTAAPVAAQQQVLVEA